MTPAYDDGRIAVFHCTAEALAEHVAGTVGKVDALIADCPYSERTHDGHDGGTVDANRANHFSGTAGGLDKDRRYAARLAAQGKAHRRPIDYGAWSPEDVSAFVAAWSVRGWIVSLTDHVLARAWEEALEQSGRYVFSPLACVETGSRVRLGGDGPAQWSTWAVVARPRTAEFHGWGSLPGAYTGPSERKPWVGGKPLWLMRALVRDYSRPGDLVCDPCMGAGTTAVACRYEGRRFIGCDMDPRAVETTIKRLRGERLGEVREDMPADADHALALFGRDE